MQKVLLIGDSIRMFYQKEVENLLGEGYEVVAPTENCRFSLFTLNSLRFWLADEKMKNPDIIHWNNGLWDLAILYKEDGPFVSLENYLDNMKKILRELKKTGAKIVFATTTPCTDDKKDFPGPFPPANDNHDIERYNKAMLEMLKSEPVEINDLWSVMYENRHELLSEDKIHPNERGVKLLGKAVADKIKSLGNYKNPLSENVKEQKTQYIIHEEKTIQ